MKKMDLKVEDKDCFFEELLSKCKHKECYSVIETAKNMGVTFTEVISWAQSNENWAYILVLCQEFCNFHIEDAALEGMLSEQESLKYTVESQQIFDCFSKP